MSGPTVVQFAAGSNSGAGTMAAAFGSGFAANVIPGNVLVCVAGTSNTASVSTPTAGQNGWTNVASNNQGGSGPAIQVWVREAVSGDNKTPTMPYTSGPNSAQYGSFNYFVAMWEITGCDVASIVDKAEGGVLSASGGTTTNQTSSNANDLALFAAMVYTGAITPSGGSPGSWTTDDNTTRVSWALSFDHQAVASSGATVNLTIGATGSYTPSYIQVLLNPSAGAPSTETGTVAMALGKATFAAGVARTEDAATSLALKGVSFVADAVNVNEYGAVSLALGKATLRVNTVDVTAEPVLVNFYTF